MEPNNPVEENQSTPDVKTSVAIKIGLLIVVALVVVIGLTKLSNDYKDTNSSKSQNENKKGNSDKMIENDNIATLNLIEVNYNNYLAYTLKGGQKVKVMLTNDYCPIWTSSQINMYQSDGSKRVIRGTKIIQGLKSSKTSSYLFENTTDEPILVKVGRSEKFVKNFKFD